MLTALLLSFVLGTDDFAIDEFVFAWTVDKIGDNELLVMKDDNSTAIRMRDNRSGLTLSPADAVAVGKTLKRTDEFWKLLLDKPLDHDEIIEISSGLKVVFFKTKGGFFVSVESGDVLTLLDRKSANRFAPHLLKSVEMAKFIDEKIKP